MERDYSYASPPEGIAVPDGHKEALLQVLRQEVEAKLLVEVRGVGGSDERSPAEGPLLPVRYQRDLRREELVRSATEAAEGLKEIYNTEGDREIYDRGSHGVPATREVGLVREIKRQGLVGVRLTGEGG